MDTLTSDHRKKFGQFFTPEPVATWMIRWVLAGGSPTLYDPAFGLGAFYVAARQQQFQGHFHASELDPEILRVFLAQEQNSLVNSGVNLDRLHLRQENYLAVWEKSHAAIVCNPPYLRFQKIADRDPIFAQFQHQLQLKLSGYTNLASAFLIKSIHELLPGGRLAYLMPLEFLNTGYGSLVKRLLLEQGQEATLIKLNCEREVFPQVITSLGIVLFEKQGAETAPTRSVQFFVVDRLHDLPEILNHPPQQAILLPRDCAPAPTALAPTGKWLRFFEPGSHSLDPDRWVPLSTYGVVRRGIATGANEFFILKAAQVRHLGLSTQEVTPCISKSAQIKMPLFRAADLEALIAAEAGVYLLTLEGTLSVAAAKYIGQGEALGFDQRYLTRSRTPWYKSEKRQPAPLLFGVFCRHGFKVVRNLTGVIHLTCYHGFEPKVWALEYLNPLFLYFLSATGQHLLTQQRRVYGDRLDKFEPNDLNQVLCPAIERWAQIPPDRLAQELHWVEQYGQVSGAIEDMFAGWLR